MLKPLISLMLLSCVSLTSLADVVAVDNIYKDTDSAYDKSYIDLIVPLSRMIETEQSLGTNRQEFKNFAIEMSVVDNKVKKIVIVIKPRQDMFYMTRSSEEFHDNLEYFKQEMEDLGWEHENYIKSVFTDDYVFTKADVELFVTHTSKNPLEIDIKRIDLRKERSLYDKSLESTITPPPATTDK